MLALHGIYENGVLKLEKPIIVDKPLKVIVTFIDEDLTINYQSNDLNKETDDYDKHISKLKTKYNDLPIIWGEGEPNIDDFAGIWKDKKITSNQLREKAWKRNL